MKTTLTALQRSEDICNKMILPLKLKLSGYFSKMLLLVPWFSNMAQTQSPWAGSRVALGL
jgi:hypothetical protein